MPIDLGNLNISIQQFQAVSRGKYNAGDVKLASDHSLERINNHVRMQGLNKVPISHDEVLAVKNAFVKALSGNGVGDEEIARVRVHAPVQVGEVLIANVAGTDGNVVATKSLNERRP